MGILTYLAQEVIPIEFIPDTIKVVKEINIDISKQTSNHIDEFIKREINVLITVCDDANRPCPNFPTDVRRFHWNIDDPSFYPSRIMFYMENFRKIRKELEYYVDIFLGSFGRT